MYLSIHVDKEAQHRFLFPTLDLGRKSKKQLLLSSANRRCRQAGFLGTLNQNSAALLFLIASDCHDCKHANTSGNSRSVLPYF